ncbi:hypothetical protein JCM17846_02090 [Iodidimonas nitroreducens]|uniref:Uncharacterized protein n=1 Tax=Iodidimonas nitroreducens TaxID=1236968 RepID=A0A5A7N3C0_9PROT|nr:hypothetical protein JCM17846_02090 [Iodidimonas nitroreducens]
MTGPQTDPPFDAPKKQTIDAHYNPLMSAQPDEALQLQALPLLVWALRFLRPALLDLLAPREPPGSL